MYKICLYGVNGDASIEYIILIFLDFMKIFIIDELIKMIISISKTMSFSLKYLI